MSTKAKSVTKPATKAAAKPASKAIVKPVPQPVEAKPSDKPAAKPPQANLKITVAPGASNTARTGSKRHYWIAACMAAKSVSEALNPPAKLQELAPAGTGAPTMGHVVWCVKNKLIVLGTPVA